MSAARPRPTHMKAITLLRFATAGLAAGAGLALLVQTASAEAPAETAIQGWVASLDASPDWNAAYKTLTYDAASDRAVLTGLSISSQATGIDITLGTVALTGFTPAADGGFTASRITADKGTLAMGPFSIALSNAELNGFTMPALPALTWDPQHPYTSFLRAYAPISRLSLTNGLIGSLSVTTDNAGVASRIVYDQFRIDRWTGGKIAGITAGPLSMETPHPDGLMQMEVASFEAHDIDLGAALKVFNPDNYAGGIGDGVWHKVTGLAAYHDFAIAGPGVKLTMKLLSLEDFKLRQPPHSLAGDFDALMGNANTPPSDTQMAQAIVDSLSTYGFGRLGVSGLDIAAAGMNGFHIGGFNISDLSSDGLGELALDNFATDVPDVGTVKLGHFAIGDMAFPGADAMTLAVLADIKGIPFNSPMLAPKPGFVEMSGLDVATVAAPRFTLDRLRVDLAHYVGAIATSISTDLKGLVLPASLLQPGAQAVFSKLGYNTLDLGYHARIDWNEADKTLVVDPLTIDLKNGGRLSLTMQLGGVPRSAFADPQTLSAMLPDLTLKSARLTLKDDSFVGKGLDLLAEKMHAKPETFRKRFAGAMPLLLSLFVLHDPKVATLVRKSGILAKLAPVVQDFIAAPGSSVTVSLAPPTPVAIPAITEAADKDPAALIDLLGLTAASSAAPPKAGGAANTPPQTPTTPDKAKAPVAGATAPTQSAQ